MSITMVAMIDPVLQLPAPSGSYLVGITARCSGSYLVGRDYSLRLFSDFLKVSAILGQNPNASADASKNWKLTHNAEHHTYTNVQGRDHDIGCGLLRMSADLPWEPRFLAQPAADGVSVHRLPALRGGAKPQAGRIFDLQDQDWYADQGGIQADVEEDTHLAGQGLCAAPAAGRSAGAVGAGRQYRRQSGAQCLGLCGDLQRPFPEQVEQFPESVIENDTRGQWYVRQLLGSANFSGDRLLHVMSGNPGFQI